MSLESPRSSIGECSGGLDDERVVVAVKRAVQLGLAVGVGVAAGATLDRHRAGEAFIGAFAVWRRFPVALDRASVEIEDEASADRGADIHARAHLARERAGRRAFL